MSPSSTSPGQPQNMHSLRLSQYLSCPRSTLLLSLLLFAGLAGCGPASDNSTNLGPRASGAVPPTVQKSPAPRNDSAPPATNPMPFAAGTGGVPGVNIRGSGDGLQSQPADIPNANSIPLIPDSITKDLNSPDARVRLRAMSHWGSKETSAPLDPLFEAMDDEDPAVQAKAIEIIERYWAAEQERERS